MGMRGRFELTIPSDRPIFVSFYTPSYEPLAHDLSESLHKFELEHYVEKVPDLGSWVKNCAYKPKFCWRMMERFPNRRLCWIDADAVVVKYPALLMLPLMVDLAVHTYVKKNRNHSNETLSGTVYLGATKRARMLVDRWIEECYFHPSAWDQRTLQTSIEKIEGIQVLNLPVEYCWIYDTHKREYPDKEPIVLHRQYSRVVKGRTRK